MDSRYTRPQRLVPDRSIPPANREVAEFTPAPRPQRRPQPQRQQSLRPSPNRPQPAAPVRISPDDRRRDPARPQRRQNPGGAQQAIALESATRNPIIREGIEPWSARVAGPSDPLYYGAQNVGEWHRREGAMMSALASKLRTENIDIKNARDLEDLTAEFNELFGVSASDLANNAKTAQKYNRSGDRRELRSEAQKYGVAAAHADEKLGRALLELSGFDQPRMLNNLDNYATDLQATLSGRPINIDSQKKLNPEDLLTIGALKNVEIPGGAGNFLAHLDEETTVLDALLDLQKASRIASQRSNGQPGLVAGLHNTDVSGQEDKLLQSINPSHNPYASEDFYERQDLMRKDALLISDHSGIQLPRSLKGHGNFNSTVPHKGFTLLDLESLRNDLGSMTLHDLMAGQQGMISPVGIGQSRGSLQEQAAMRGNRIEDVKLKLPMRFIREVNNNLRDLSPDALRQLGL